jgi:integrase
MAKHDTEVSQAVDDPDTVRLACCCGLRVSEIAALQLDDVVIEVPRPHLRLRRGTTKGGRSRLTNKAHGSAPQIMLLKKGPTRSRDR